MLKLEQDEANFKYNGKAGNVTDLTFGQKLRQLRRKAGLTQEEFAEVAACSADHITKMERGSRLPSSRLLRALVQSLENLGIERKSLDTLESLLLDYKLTPSKPRPLVEDEVLTENEPPPEIAPNPIIPNQSKIPRLYAAVQPSPALGREAQLQQILNFYCSNQGSQLVAITGLGGIGKTTLAFETAERALNQKLFEQVIWESAKTQAFHSGEIEEIEYPTAWLNFSGSFTFEGLLNSLAYHLNRQDLLENGISIETRLNELSLAFQQIRCLIVVDNLETSHNPRMVLTYLQRLLRQSNSCILTTSRDIPPFLAGYHLHLGALDASSALALLKQEARLSNLSSLLDDSAEVKEAMRQIANFSGGHPLTMKLIIQQLKYLSFDRILQSLSTGYNEKARLQNNLLGGLYSYIYRQGWEALNPKSQGLLLKLKAAPECLDEDDLMVLYSGVETATHETMADLDMVLAELVRYCFLEVRGGLKKNYCFQPLTLNFLKTDLAEYWETPDEPET